MNSEDSANVWDYRIRELFRNTEKDATPSDILWQVVNLVLYESSQDTTLIEIYNTLDHDNFIRLVQLLDGRQFKSPTRHSLEEALLTAVFYYEREFKKKTWKEIQDDLDFEISPRKYGIRVRNLNNYISQKVQELIRSLPDTKGDPTDGRE
jgi:hypothetical protein